MKERDLQGLAMKLISLGVEHIHEHHDTENDAMALDVSDAITSADIPHDTKTELLEKIMEIWRRDFFPPGKPTRVK